MAELITQDLFGRASQLPTDDQVALLFRLWGFLEGRIPEFREGVERFVPMLEEEAEDRKKK